MKYFIIQFRQDVRVPVVPGWPHYQQFPPTPTLPPPLPAWSAPPARSAPPLPPPPTEEEYHQKRHDWRKRRAEKDDQTRTDKGQPPQKVYHRTTYSCVCVCVWNFAIDFVNENCDRINDAI